MHAERYELSSEAAEQLNAATRVIAVGTTAARTLEHAAKADGPYTSASGETDLFIYPGYEFRALDGLLTNFHLPSSTLLMLVCAFAGRELILKAYEHAVREEYRFYSYGDCMLVI
jgi:S-adenosylmethionine:tRNA ribosyltransferase-isomerase